MSQVVAPGDGLPTLLGSRAGDGVPRAYSFNFGSRPVMPKATQNPHLRREQQSHTSLHSLPIKTYFSHPHNLLPATPTRSRHPRCTLALEAHATPPTTRHHRGKLRTIHASS